MPLIFIVKFKFTCLHFPNVKTHHKCDLFLKVTYSLLYVYLLTGRFVFTESLHCSACVNARPDTTAEAKPSAMPRSRAATRDCDKELLQNKSRPLAELMFVLADLQFLEPTSGLPTQGFYLVLLGDANVYFCWWRTKAMSTCGLMEWTSASVLSPH